MARSPVTAVIGPGGLGKTSLVLSALHGRRPSCLERTLSFSASPGDRSGEQLGLAVLGALSEMLGGGRLGGVALTDRASFAADVVDLADTLDCVVVLDDLHFVEGDLIRDLLQAAASYARRARFVVTSRAPIGVSGMEGQIVELGPLGVDALASLASQWSPGLGDAEAGSAAREANGSPFWLKQHLSRTSTSLEVMHVLLSDLAEPTRRWVLAMARLEIPIREGAACRLGGAPAAGELARLEQRGLLERVPEGLRLHAVARAALLASEEDVPANIAAQLRASGDPALELESIRLDKQDGRLDDAIGTAQALADDLVAAGLAPRLWQVLEDVFDERLISPKLACALDLAGGAALTWAVEQASPRDPMLRLRWLEVLAHSSALERAVHDALLLAEETRAREPPLAAAALLIAARAFVQLNRPREALDASAGARDLGEGDPVIEARADVYAARAHVFEGQTERALSLVAALEPRVGALDPKTRREIDDQRASVYFNLGRSRRAHDLFLRMHREGLVSPEQLGVRTRLVRGSLFALELGDLEEARRLLDELAPVARRSQELFAFYSMNELRYAAAMGELSVAEEHLAALVRATSASNSGYWSAWIAAPHHYLGLLRGASLDPRTAARDRDYPLTRALGAWHEVRATGRATRLEAASRVDVVDADIVLGLARATGASLARDSATAVREARAAQVLAEEEGLVLWQADALATLCECFAASGDDGLLASATHLERVAAGLGRSRYVAEASFFLELGRGARADVAVFDKLAATGGACAATRRARAILGFDAVLDKVDEAIVARARTALAAPTRVTASGADRPGLGLDTKRARVLLPAGDPIDLSKRPVAMKILVALFDGGGRASKQALVEQVWGRSDYHPLRDDKRLQVAISRLRVLLGDEALVETTEEGYGLAPTVAAYRV